MKKAKRLLAVLLAAVMIMTAAYLSSYAYTDANNYANPSMNNIKGYYLTYDQTAGYLLDMLDQMLAELNIVITCNELNDAVGIGINLFTSNILLNLDEYLYDAGVTRTASQSYGFTAPSAPKNDQGYVDLRNIDLTIRSLYGVADCLANNWVRDLGDAVGLLGDLVDKNKGLGRLWTYSSLNYLRNNNNDVLVLEYLVQLIVNGLGPMVRDLLGQSFDAGSLLEGTLDDLLKDLLGPRASLKTIGTGVKDLLYSMLINEDAQIMNGDNADGTQVNELDDPATPEIERVETVDDMVQKVLDWALIEGTGEFIYQGGNSLLGKNEEALLPDLANQPGGASISAIPIQADHDLDGAVENHTMSLYQLVNNVLEAVLGGMLVPVLTDLLVDLCDVKITEQYPNGDPEVMQDVMFNTILGAVEGLLVQNGAPALDYSVYDTPELPVDTPVGKITALCTWFLKDGGLDTLIKVDYKGIHIQDNFMSLLNDIARLAINLLPGLGLFEDGTDLAYTADELNKYYAYDADKNIVVGGSEGEVDSLYLTYKYNEIIYVDQYINNADGTKTPSVYCYFENGAVVNTTNPSEANYRNPAMIRQYYVISTNQVYACLIKMALDSFIDGCYFPEWADTIPSVLAYGLAALASPVLPQNNYFARLDAYHQEQTRGSDVFDASGVNVTPIPYSVEKTIVINDPAGSYTKTVVVPQAALDIGCSYLASYLNNILDINDQEKLDTDTSLEKFAGEFLVWGFTKYLPMFTGKMEGGVLKNYTYSGIKVSSGDETAAVIEDGIFKDEVNAYLAATYKDWATRTPISDDDNDASFDAIYTLLDQTLFKLLPTSWLPDIHGSQQFVLDWLFNNLTNFDLQGILGLFSVNESADAELNHSVTEVLIRVVDRVLALLVNDHPLLLDINRGQVVTAENYIAPSITTLEGLLDCSSPNAALPQLVYQLLVRLNQFKRPLLATLLPLLLSSNYERPYDSQYLGSKGIAYYKVANFENYISSLTDHINATLIKSFDNVEDASAAAKGGATTVRNSDGTYSVKLRNGTIFGTYSDLETASNVADLLEDAYYIAVDSGEVDELGEKIISSYDVYYRENYKTAARKVNITKDKYDQNIYEYTNFSYATFYPRSSERDMVAYGKEYQTFEPEDFSGKEYYYTNYNSIIDDAEDYLSSYRSFATNNLPNAYGDWLMFSIKTQLRTYDIWDANGDGKSVMDNTTDTDYVAPTLDANNVVTDPGVPVDGEPGMPSSMYPFYTTNETPFSFYDDVLATTVSSEMMNQFNADSYEQIALALEYGKDKRNNVTLSESDTESVIRLALYEACNLGAGALEFDITYNADNVYDGSLQWQTLSAEQLAAVQNWLTAQGFTYEEILDVDGNATGAYTIARPAFRLIDSSFKISTPAVALNATPAATGDATLTEISNISILSKKTTYQERYVDLHNAYKDYITALYQNRRSLYNIMDEVSYRTESAEAVRSIPMQNNGDIIVLDWALSYANSYYKDRNYKSTGNVVNGVAEVTKIYTSTSFDNFEQAYDYAFSLREKITANAAVSNEITQSMVTDAYQGLLKAIRQLVEFTGFADWTQLDYYIEMAEGIIDGPVDDPVLGIESGLENLITVYNDSITLRNDPTIDCESQSKVDSQYATLSNAIFKIVYKSLPKLVADENSDSTIDTISVTYDGSRIVGHIFGLEEGMGINNDMIKGEDPVLSIAGMTINENEGSVVGLSPSGRGNGTGAYLYGNVRTNEKFRYYAVIYGDLNGDSRIDGSDASYIQYYMANGENNENDMGNVMFVAADANHDNVVDSSDILLIQNHYTYKSKIAQNEHRIENVNS